MAKAKQKISIYDLNLSAFQKLHGNEPVLELQGTRVIFLFDPNEVFNRISERYNSNEMVPVLDYVSATRQLRSMMMSRKAGQR